MNRSYKNTTIAILLACILTMAIGYAVLNQQLNISGTSHITTNFNVKFTNISSEATGTATNKIDPSYTATTATFNTNLVSPGDSMEYSITVSNNGNTDAELDLITITDSSNPAIVFAYSGVAQGDILKAGSSVIVKVTVTYNPNVTTQPDTLNTSLTFKLDYSQLDNVEETPIVKDYLAVASDDSSLGNWLGSGINHNQIEAINFTTSNEVPSEYESTGFDASEAQNGSIMGWYTDTDGDNLYEITIGQEGGVNANANSAYLFKDLEYLTTIDVSNLNTSDVTEMALMFANDYSLTTLDLSSWNTENVESMTSMFGSCEGLESVNVLGWDTSKVLYMDNLFYNCPSLKELDLSSWNTASVYYMNYMFYSNYALSKIYVSDLWSIAGVGASFDMFTNATNLVGAVAYSESNANDVTMANYTTGYFTYKAYNG